MQRILKRQPVDRIGLYEHFWNDTHREWVAQGKLRENDEMADVFGFDMDEHWSFNLVADLDFKPRILAEDADTVTALEAACAVWRQDFVHGRNRCARAVHQ